MNNDDRQRALDRLKASNASTSGDPLRLQASGKARRYERARRDDLTRKPNVVEFLLGKKTINEKMARAARHFHELVLVQTGGMQAMDWLRERVDGGKLSTDMSTSVAGTLDAERELRDLVRLSGMGIDQFEVVMRVIGLEETLTSVAHDLEKDESMRRLGGCSRETRSYVKCLLCDGLMAAHNAMYAANQHDERPARKVMRAWLAEGASGQDRPDLRGETRTRAWGA